MTTVKAGALAYYDSFTSGLVPVKVAEVITPGPGDRVAGAGTAEVRAIVTAHRGGWCPRDEITASGAAIIPRTHVRFTRSGARIRSDYRWEK